MKKKVESFISSKIDQGYYSGSQVLIAQKGNVLVDLCHGYMTDNTENPSEKVNFGTLFNIESITKVMVTLPLAFRLIQDGKLSLENRVIDFIPEFGTSDLKKKITILDMLNFTGGIPLDDPSGCLEAALDNNQEKAWDLHFSQELKTQPGKKVFYSDVSCRIFGKILERIMGRDLDIASKELIFDPLGMNDTMFNPFDKKRCAATGISDCGRVLRGELVQDLEHYMGEILGSDGLFTNARDMLKFSSMLLKSSKNNGKNILEEKTIDKMIGEITNSHVSETATSYLHYILSGPKVWFWESAYSPYSFFGDMVSQKAIGKLGGAGTFLLIDPEYDLVVVYLTNYGQPENTLIGDNSWNKFQNELDMMGLCNLVIENLPG